LLFENHACGIFTWDGEYLVLKGVIFNPQKTYGFLGHEISDFIVSKSSFRSEEYNTPIFRLGIAPSRGFCYIKNIVNVQLIVAHL